MSRKVLLVIAIVALLLLTSVQVAFAHAELIRSDPAADAVLANAPSQVRMWFDEDIDAQLSQIQVLDSRQARVDKGDLALAPNDPKQIAISLNPLADGTYTVVWNVLSATDGHVTRGIFAFSVGKPSATGVLPSAGQPAESGNQDPLAIAVRWLDLLAILTLAGALFFRDLVLRPSLRSVGSDFTDLSRFAWQRLFIVALTVGLFAEVAELILEARQATGAFTPDQVARILFDTRLGVLWITRWVALTVAGLLVLGVRTRESALVMLGEFAALIVLYFGIVTDPRLVGQLGALSASLVRAGIVDHLPHIIPFFLFVAIVIFRDETTRSLVSAILLLLALLTLALASHSAAEGLISLAVVAEWVHLIAVATWMGGLVTLAWLMRPVWRSLSEEKRRPWLIALLARFSPAAISSVVLIVLTGLYIAGIQIPSVDALIRTVYGQTLDAKVLLFLVLFAMGAVQILVMQGQIAQAQGDHVAHVGKRFRGLVSAEVVVGVLVIGLAGLLSSSPPARVALAKPLAAPPAQASSVKLFAHPASDLNIALSFSSGSQQTVDLTLADANGQSPTDVLRVILEFTLLDQDVGVTLVNIDQGFNGRYVASGNYTTVPGMWEVGVIVRRKGVPDISATFPWYVPDAQATKKTEPRALDWLEKSDHAMNALTSVRSTQDLNDGANAVVTTAYEYQAPDRMHFVIKGQGESVTIGGTQYYIDNGVWKSQSRVEPFSFPDYQNARAHAIRLGRTVVLGNQTMQIVLADSADDPKIHFAYWIGTADLLLHRLAMVAPAHLMIQTYYDYDAPVRIEAPPSP